MAQALEPGRRAGWSHAGILRTGETYRDKVKLTFANGARLPDPSGLFGSRVPDAAR